MSLDVVPSSRSTVFLASASPLDCQLLAASLARNHLQVSGWAVNSSEVISAINNYKPNAAVIGARLQDGALAGFSALREIRLLRSDSRVVMLLDASEPGLVIEAFRQGAAGVFSRTQKSSDLRKCIHSVLAGQIWANHQEIGYLVESLRTQPSPPLAKLQGVALLTKREEEVRVQPKGWCVQREVSPAKVTVRSLVAWIAGRRETKSLKPIDKAIFRMVSKSSGRNESECSFGLENLTPEAELSLLERRQHGTSQTDWSGGSLRRGLSSSTMARTHQATGEALLVPPPKGAEQEAV